LLKSEVYMRSEALKYWLRDIFCSRSECMAITFIRNGHVETNLSYSNLDCDTNKMANTLMDRGVRKGDRVILYLQKSIAFVVAHIALQKIGAIGVPLNPGFKKSEMEYLLHDTQAALALVDPEQENMIREIDPQLHIIVVDTKKPYQDLDFFSAASDNMPGVEIKADDPGLIIYTSGTTGKPKGAILTHGNLIHDARNIIHIWEIKQSDVMCHALPLFHVHGLCFELHTALLAGASTIMLDRFSPEEVIDVLAKNEGEYVCTLFMAVPAIYAKLIEYMEGKSLDFGHIRLWTSGSAPLLVKDFERIKNTFGKEPVEREGMTETGMNFSNPLKGIRTPGSIGLPTPQLDVRIVDPETFLDVTPGQTGEIWLKGPSITPGYWRKPEETSKAFENGWFKSGDLGRVDEDGYYYLTDRIKHIIISGGENISPKEVEAVINQVDGVAESSVVGIADEKWGEKVVAAVVLKPGSTVEADMIQSFCKKHLHDWKVPKDIAFIEELPRNKMGKVIKEDVKKVFSN
jgi:malonyl-CoA/methylmalonyl-CoA synthetase